ncbi:MAG TPA: hypothetical protein VJ965_04565, partial [Anaerolineales bacterium]|nr:hypothetical protein [Anaerolineales bacterium]
MDPGTDDSPTFWKSLQQNIQLLWARFMAWMEGFRLTPGWTRGAVWAAGVLVALSGAYNGLYAFTGFGTWVDIVVFTALSLLGYLALIFLGPWLLRLLFKLPPLLWVSAGAAVAAQIYFWNDYTWINWIFIAAASLGALALGASLYAILKGDWRGALLRKKIMLVFLLLLGTAAVVTLGVFFFHPGTPAASLAVQVPLGSPTIDAPNPALPGDYEVHALTYGSGTDRWRPEYGAEADLITQPVSAASYVSYKGWKGKMRQWFWGFSPAETPVNGRVWYPEGEGPFPLVLIAHGNHAMTDYSDPGYAYLGELLASRGFITVSVDQNFFNGGIYGESSGENDARAWLLLKHIEVWEGWNIDPDSQFYRRVDLENIGLIGHSRGGEAAVHAAAFNQLSRYPTNARIQWRFNYGIKAVAAIAPVDKQYQPGDHPTTLTDVSYLVLQGSHDSDLDNFLGIQQFDRIKFSGEDSGSFAAAVYIYRANHGQFNTVWGDRDSRAIKGQFLNRRALLSGEEQRQAASLFLSAFLETNLHGNPEYLTIFQDYRTAGDWLPQTGYIAQYRDAGEQIVAAFEEDADVTTLSLDGGSVSVSNSLQWSEQQLRFRDNKRQDDHVVRLRWSGIAGAYTLT